MLISYRVAEKVREATKRVVRQGGPSVRGNPPTCAYRGEGGRRCAIGWLIDDLYYSTDLEGNFFGAYPVVEAVEASGNFSLSTPEALFLGAFQRAHDNNYHCSEFTTLFAFEVGKLFNEWGISKGILE